MFKKFLPVNKITKLMNLVKLTLWQSYLCKKKWRRQVFRKWRFYSHMKALSKNKVTSLYKTMHLTYLMTSEEITEEGEEVEDDAENKNQNEREKQLNLNLDYLKFFK